MVFSFVLPSIHNEVKTDTILASYLLSIVFVISVVLVIQFA